MKPRHLYVHAPFCARRCSYCDFAVQVNADPPVEAWAQSLGSELRALAAAEEWMEPLPLETLYVGGGTPSLLGPSAMDRLRTQLGGLVSLDGLVEWTSEANPESFTADVAAAWRRAGVDRLSFGAQTFHGPSLRWMGRLHGPEGPVRAVGTARAAGFENLSIDLIFALPERLGRDLDADLDRILALEPEHVSVYGLSVEPETPLGRWVAEGRESVPDQDRYGDEFLRVSERLRSEGYRHYEVSNFARPGRESRHNSAYWRGVPYIGLGNGAHSFVPPRRWWNVRDWAGYRRRVAAQESPRDSEETLSALDTRLERIWLGLRHADGLDRNELDAGQLRLAGTWSERGLAEWDSRSLRLTPEGWLLLDRLSVEMDEAAGVVA